MADAELVAAVRSRLPTDFEIQDETIIELATMIRARARYRAREGREMPDTPRDRERLVDIIEGRMWRLMLSHSVHED